MVRALAESDQIVAAVSRIHAAGLDPALWPEALAGITDLIGGNGASLEFLDKASLRPHGMHTHGLPDVSAYIEHYAPMCPRLPYAARHPAGTICHDALCISEAEMDRNPFYAELLAPLDMRYFIGAVIATSPKELVISGVQLSPKHGHPSPAKIRMMSLLVPHIQQATDVMRRVGHLSRPRHSHDDVLDWLADGVLKLAADGSVRYANHAAQKIFRRNDGIAKQRGGVEFLSTNAAANFGRAMRELARLRDAEVTALKDADFIAETRAGTPPYSVSIRPASQMAEPNEGVVALMFIHDPLGRRTAVVELLRQAFGLTAAEADVANALRSGLSADAYAQARKVSANTVYTHIRRIKAKIGCTRMTELIRKLNDVQVTVIRQR